MAHVSIIEVYDALWRLKWASKHPEVKESATEQLLVEYNRFGMTWEQAMKPRRIQTIRGGLFLDTGISVLGSAVLPRLALCLTLLSMAKSSITLLGDQKIQEHPVSGNFGQFYNHRLAQTTIFLGYSALSVWL